MRNTRRLWVSIIFVMILASASIAGLVTGAISPVLGLDLQGGVAVILSAQATDKSVNIATRRLYPQANTPAAIRGRVVAVNTNIARSPCPVTVVINSGAPPPALMR